MSGPDVDVAGKVALITGGGSGIGAAVAAHLAEGGAKVVVADIDEAAGEAVARAIGGAFVRCDVASLAQNRAAVAAVLDRHGRLDLAFLNAGVASGCGLGEDFDPRLYRRAMGVNLDGVVFGVHAALPALLESGGTIVVTASMAGIVGMPQDPVYAANKHAVVGLVRSLGQDLAPRGVKVHALCPSFTDTPLLRGGVEALREIGMPILDVAEVVDAFFRILAAEGTGECWFVVPGRPSEPFVFRRAPGPRVR